MNEREDDFVRPASQYAFCVDQQGKQVLLERLIRVREVVETVAQRIQFGIKGGDDPPPTVPHTRMDRNRRCPRMGQTEDEYFVAHFDEDRQRAI
jgi:hypothetical protein